MEFRTALRSALALLAIVSCSTSQAQLFRTYLSVNGNDANPCTVSQPCRLLPAALAAMADGGEVWILDSANYNTGTVIVGKSATILAIPGAVGSLLAIGGPAVSITAPSLKIALRNLVIVPFPGGGGPINGVEMTGASALTIENSLIANLPQSGVYVNGTGTVEIHNSVIRGNGVWAVSLLDGASADISGTKMLDNGSFSYGGGVAAGSELPSTTTATVSDSVISGGNDGIYAYATGPGGFARIFVTRCTIQNTGYALHSETLDFGFGSAVVALSYSTVTNNNSAWVRSGTGSIIRTLGNNHIADNTTSQGSLTSASLQ